MATSTDNIEQLANQDYKYGFVTDIDAEAVPPGLNEEIIRIISAKKEEPEWLLEWRLNAFRVWQTMTEPKWHNVHFPPVDFQDIIYYSAPKQKPKLESLDDLDPEIKATFDKLGVPIEEQKVMAGVAVDAVFDSVSVATTFKDKLADLGIVFCSFSEAVRDHPDLVRKYLGSVVPASDNFYAALNSAVFSDGSFAYIPKGVKCPMELSTYFRINAAQTGQFERTLLVADEGATVSYLEGCTAPMRDENQLHAAVVELVALDDATIKYSTVQNWYPGDKDGKGGIYNFVTKRGKASTNAKITWTQVETGSAITGSTRAASCRETTRSASSTPWPSPTTASRPTPGPRCSPREEHPEHHRLEGNLGRQGPEHLPRPRADRQERQGGAQLLAVRLAAHRRQVRRAHLPYLEVRNTSSQVEHEASTSKIGEDQIFYCRQRGLSTEDAVNMIVNGFCKEVFRELPMEFAVEAQKLLGVSLEGSVG